jgi:anti-sigma regulatory factor (Ser/Thr protein kinase)
MEQAGTSRGADSPLPHKISLPHDETAPAIARRFVSDNRDHLDAGLIEDAQLLVTEIVTNAVRYGQAEITVELRLDPPALGVAVADSGEQMSERPPASPPVPATASRGRGLSIVDAIATQWGVTPQPDQPGKIVWFDLRPT